MSERDNRLTPEEWREVETGYRPHPDSAAAASERFRQSMWAMLDAIDEAFGYRLSRTVEWLSRKRRR